MSPVSSKLEGKWKSNMEQDLYSTDINGTKATCITLKYSNPVAHALAKITQYKDKLSAYPKDSLDVEEPAFAIQYFEKAMPKISEKMYNFMHDALSKCTKETTSNSYAEKIKASKTKIIILNCNLFFL